jgi:hypothetical protein
MFDAATKALGPLSAVIANAGIVAPTSKLAEMSVERMRRVFEDQCARRLPHRPRGHAANIEVLWRSGRIDRHDVIGRRAPRLAEPLCRLVVREKAIFRLLTIEGERRGALTTI